MSPARQMLIMLREGVVWMDVEDVCWVVRQALEQGLRVGEVEAYLATYRAEVAARGRTDEDGGGAVRPLDMCG